MIQNGKIPLVPVITPIIFIAIKLKITINRPRTANVMIFQAFATFSGFPPAVNHVKAAYNNIMRNPTAAARVMKGITKVTIVEILPVQAGGKVSQLISKGWAIYSD